MDDSGGRSNPKAAGYVPKVEVDTVRPPGEGGDDAYSAETVVRTLPPEMLRQYAKALRPAALPKIASEPLAPPESDATPPIVASSQPRSDRASPTHEPDDDEPRINLDADEAAPLSAHAAVSTRHPGEELAPPDEDAQPAAGAPEGATKDAAQKADRESEMLSLWIGLGLIAAVAVGLLVSQCR